MSTRSPTAAPLLLTRDPDLLDDLLRLAAATGTDPVVLPEAGSARREWDRAALVLVGSDLADDVLRRGLPRRDGVILVGRSGDPRDAGAERAGVFEVAVAIGAREVAWLPEAESWLVDRFTDAAEGGGRKGRVVAVMGGRGGAGATTLAVGLALAGVRSGRRCTLIDGDPLGGGIDLALGAEDTAGMRWPDLAGTSGRVAAARLQAALPLVEELTVLSWDRGDLLTIPGAAMESVLEAAKRGSDLVIIDMPRRLESASELALRSSDLTLLLVTADVRATAAAARVAASVGNLAAHLQVVVRGPAPSHLSGPDVATALGLPLAGSMGAEKGVAEAMERGEAPGRSGRGPLAGLCRELLSSPLLAPAAEPTPRLRRRAGRGAA